MKAEVPNAEAEVTEKQPETYTTGEMARRSGNTLRTVRFYEEAGILQPLGRTVGGHRVFARSQLDRLLLVSDMREAGLSLEEIRSLLETKSRATSGGHAATAAMGSLEQHLGALRAKIDVLARLAGDLEQTIAAAAACKGCEEVKPTAEMCGGCGRVAPTDQLPRSMRVLWSIGERSASKDDGVGSSGARRGVRA
jgi:MerR family Zn(II)-responsive transcriptional regulator of zntA